MPYTVTQRVYAIEQPKGGYLPLRNFSSKSYKNGRTLNATENVHGKYVGLAVDYLTRFRMINDADAAFEISMLSAEILRQHYGQIDHYNFCRQLLEAVKKGGIAEAVQRGVDFLNCCGPIVQSGFTLEGGYTSTVVNGDGDYLARNPLINFKVLRSDFTKEHSLQILMYYLMGLHSVHAEFKQVKWIALFNPRKNLVKFVNVNQIASSVIAEVNRKVIGY